MAYAKLSGIYKIVCGVSGKHYVGSAVSVKGRWASHLSLLKRGVHPNKHLQNAWERYGEKAFSFVLIEECAVDRLIEREQHWIDQLHAADPSLGMNNSPTATNKLGFRHSASTRERLSAIAKSRDHSRLRELAKERIGKPSLSRGTTGIPWTAEQKAKASAKRKGRAPWNVGVSMPADVKAKVSASVTANRRVIPQDVRDRICDLRAQGLSYPRIAEETGVSIAQTHRIATGYVHAMRTVEKVNGIRAGH